MRRILMTALFTASVAVPAAWADQSSSGNSPGFEDQNDMYVTDDNSIHNSDADLTKQNNALKPKEVTQTKEVTKTQEAGKAGDETLGVSEKRAEDVDRRGMTTEVFGIKPQFGVLDYKTQTGATETRAAIGATFEWNFANTLSHNTTRWYVGPVTGLIYSHIGNNGANFVGSGDASGGANLTQIPLNLKVGYAFSDAFRLSLRGGGNVIYRSAVETVAIGNTLTTVSGSSWNIYPNVGADVEFGLGKNVTLMLRPDFTLTSNNNMFTGTIGIAFPVG